MAEYKDVNNEINNDIKMIDKVAKTLMIDKKRRYKNLHYFFWDNKSSWDTDR